MCSTVRGMYLYIYKTENIISLKPVWLEKTMMNDYDSTNKDKSQTYHLYYNGDSWDIQNT